MNYGRLLGKMHALAKDYVPANVKWKRHAWDSPQSSVNTTVAGQLTSGNRIIKERYQATQEHIRELPRDRSWYGMTHLDAHVGNIYVDEDCRLTVFDFDDCAYGHFVHDIAVVLFYYPRAWIRDMKRFIGLFMPPFLRGYQEQNPIDARWFSEIPFFLKLREIELFCIFRAIAGENPRNDLFLSDYMRDRRASIENDRPFIDFDWESMKKYV